jgi:hypothetical protein
MHWWKPPYDGDGDKGFKEIGYVAKPVTINWKKAKSIRSAQPSSERVVRISVNKTLCWQAFDMPNNKTEKRRSLYTIRWGLRFCL